MCIRDSSNNRTTMLNKFHVWFPGGIVVGSLAVELLNFMSMGWQLKIATMILPTLIYGYMFYKSIFPKSENIETNTGLNIKSLFTPLFLFIAACMTLTAVTELGTQQWLVPLLDKSGASPMLILAMVTGVMAVGRYFAGPIVHKLNPVGVLFMSAIISTLAIYLMSIVDGTSLYFVSILFAFGVCYFWPTMIGFVSEYLPKTGALGMSLVGGMGMFATGIWQPVIGSWIDENTQLALESGLAQDLAEITAGKATLGNITYFPLILILFFGILYLNRKKLEKIRYLSLIHI